MVITSIDSLACQSYSVMNIELLYKCMFCTINLTNRLSMPTTPTSHTHSHIYAITHPLLLAFFGFKAEMKWHGIGIVDFQMYSYESLPIKHARYNRNLSFHNLRGKSFDLVKFNVDSSFTGFFLVLARHNHDCF